MRYIIFFLMALSLSLVGGIANAANQKVTICHLTSSEKNPYVIITVSENALSAHLNHGDIIFDPVDGCDQSGPGPFPQ